MQVVADDLDNLAGALRQAWNRRDIERRAASVWQERQAAVMSGPEAKCARMRWGIPAKPPAS
jgi:hypothetical protein